MGLLTPCFVPGEGFLYTIIVPGGGFLLPSSRVPGVCPGGGWFWMKLIPALSSLIMTKILTKVLNLVTWVDILEHLMLHNANQ